MKRRWYLALPIASFAAPAIAQDEKLPRVTIQVTGDGFNEYYVVRTRIFEIPNLSHDQRLRVLQRRTAPFDTRYGPRLREGESYYFFPVCRGRLLRSMPARWTISRFQRVIPLRCP